MRLQKSLLLALLASLLAACGAAGEDSPNGPSNGGDDRGAGGGGADEPAYEPEPPPGTATFYVNHNSGANDVPPGNTAKGFASSHSSEGLMLELANTGAAGGLLRHNLHINAPRGNVPTSLMEGEQIGLKTWVTVMGTPLNQSPSTDGEIYDSSLPPYARWTPMSADVWANTVITQLEHYESFYGFVPDCVEIWNEPDRVEFYNGDIDDYLKLYTVTAPKIKNRWPQIHIGGMGLAGYRSSMGGSESAILALIDHAAANNLPLDFVSWHHYTIGNGLQYSGFLEDLQLRLDSYSMSNVQLVVSEWNIYPSTSGHGTEFDSSHSAANYAGFQTTARELGLDGNIMFLLQDPSTGSGAIDDFTGNGMGAITTHGIKKPVFHVIETVQAMADEPMLTTVRPDEELSVNVYATKMGNRVRYVVSNDVVPGDWVWANRLRDEGLAPGYVWPLYYHAAKIGRPHKPTDTELLAEGMTTAEVTAIRDLEDELNLAWQFKDENRPVEIIFGGNELPNIANVHRFDSQHNNFVDHIDEIMPFLEQTEENAKWFALQAAADYFFSHGIVVSPEDLSNYADMHEWAIENDVPYNIASASITIYQKAMAEGRLFDVGLLNSLPQMSVTPMTAENAEVIAASGSVHFFMEPNSVVIFDIYL